MRVRGGFVPLGMTSSYMVVLDWLMASIAYIFSYWYRSESTMGVNRRTKRGLGNIQNVTRQVLKCHKPTFVKFTVILKQLLKIKGITSFSNYREISTEGQILLFCTTCSKSQKNPRKNTKITEITKYHRKITINLRNRKKSQNKNKSWRSQKYRKASQKIAERKEL